MSLPHRIAFNARLFSMTCLADSSFLFTSSNEPAACKKLLDKAGLEGYQVISLISRILFVSFFSLLL